jgi:hypothetical protein
MDKLMKLKVSLISKVGFVINQNSIIGEYRKLWFSGEMENELTKSKTKKRIPYLKIGFIDTTKVKNSIGYIAYMTYCKPEDVDKYTDIIKSKIISDVSSNIEITTNMQSLSKKEQ